MNELDWPELISQDLSKTIVKVEHHVGNGFIDIWINFGNACICIENKIDATDQKDQLLRYKNYCIKYNNPYKIIYLTLDGHESLDTKYSTSEKFDYTQWSYEIKIIGWLDNCIKKCARIPVLRESIYQYQQLLKKLCGRLQNENEAMELNDLLKSNSEQFEAANNIYEQFETSRYCVQREFWNDVNQYFLKKYSKEFEIQYSFNEKVKYSNLILGFKKLDHWYACYCIENLGGRTYYGIYSYQWDQRSADEKTLISRYKQLNIEEFKNDSKFWLSWKYYDNLDFSKIETLSIIFSPKGREDLIMQIFEPMQLLIEQSKKELLKINKEIYTKVI